VFVEFGRKHVSLLWRNNGHVITDCEFHSVQGRSQWIAEAKTGADRVLMNRQHSQ
jgi:hypothetical protein